MVGCPGVRHRAGRRFQLGELADNPGFRTLSEAVRRDRNPPNKALIGECAMVIDEITAMRTFDLESWESIPAMSPVWDDVELFIDSLREIAAAKLMERE